MNILILTGKFGMGHWSASQSLRTQLLGEFPAANVEVEDFFQFALDDASEAMYKVFSLLVTRGSYLYNLYYRCTENAQSKTNGPVEAYYGEKMAELIALRRPDAVIVTHPICAQIVSNYKRTRDAQLPLVTCITDLSSHSEWIHAGTDCYLVGSRDVRTALCQKGVDPSRVHVTGIPVKAEFRCKPRSHLAGRRELLIMGGGLGLMPKRSSFYEGLNALENVHTTIIAGSNKKLVEKLDGKYKNITVIGYTDHVYAYMANADLLLSKPGGITLFETICSELPILAWEPFLQQEINNAHFVTRHQIGRTAQKGARECLAAIEKLIYNDAALARMAQNMRGLKSQVEAEQLQSVVSALVCRKELRAS